MNEGEQDAIQKLLRIAAMTGLGGAALGVGSGALRNLNPRYNPPETPPPVVVDIPVPARGGSPPNPKAVPIPSKTKALPPAAAKAASGGPGLLDRVGSWFHDQLPTFHHPQGPVGATSAKEIPAFYAGIPAAVAAGGLGGYGLGDYVARAVERRRAQAELDSARKEYQDVVNARAAGLYTQKAAALLAPEPPDDPTLARTKASLDLAWVAVKEANGPAPADPGRGSSPEAKALMSWLWPGFLNPETAKVQAGVVGSLGLAGGLAGYTLARDEANAKRVREQVQARDAANAASIRSPVIARLVPTAV